MIGRLTILLLLAVAVMPSASGQFPTIELRHISQPAVQAGSDSEMQVFGVRMEELEQLVFSAPGIVAKQRMNAPPLLSDAPAPNGIFEVSVAAGVPPGTYDLRANGRFGLSNPRALIVCSKPVIRCPQKNSNAFLALEIDGDSIYLDQALPQARRFYRVSLESGQRLRAVVYAAHIDSRMVPSLILYSDNERELARGRAIRKWPAELHYTAKETGDYVLAVHDFLFRGGQEFPFLLECAIDSETEEADAPELDRLLRPVLTADRSLGRFANITRAFQAEFVTDDAGSTASPLADAAADAIEAPFHAKGSLAAGSVSYEFRATKDQVFWLDVKSSQLDQLTDPSLVLFRVDQAADGVEQLRQIAEKDDGDYFGGPEMRLRLRDPSFSWKAPEDGTYRLSLRDYESGSRPQDSMAYELIARRPRPGFSLLAHPQFPNVNRALARPFGSNLMRGGTEAVLVTALRYDGFSGPIGVFIDHLPEGITCDSTIIPPGANEAALILRADEDVVSKHFTVQLTGTAEIENKLFSRDASSSTVVWGATATDNAITARLCSALQLRVNDLELCPVFVKLGEGQTLEAMQGTTLKIPVSVIRREGGAKPCLLRAQHLPPKTSLADVQIAADKSEGSAELKLNQDVPPGEYTFWMQNETKVNWQANPQATARAQAYLAALKEALESADPDQKPELETAIEQQTKVVASLVQQSVSKELTVWLPTTSVRIRVLPAAKS